MNRKLLTFTLMTALTASAAVPEPDVIFYGAVTISPTNAAYVPGGVAWMISGNSETLTASQTTLVVVNTQTFYLTRIPFETRRLTDNTPLPATPNTLALPAAATTFNRSATVDARPAILPNGAGSFSYGAATQGLIERLDLVLGETYAEWSQRFFGQLVSQTDDADGDGLNNYNEYLAGTDPNNPQSRLFVTSFAPAPGGGVTFQWDSVSGKTYAVARSLDLQTWTILQANIAGTGGSLSFTDPNAAGNPKLFYRVTASGGP